MWSVRWRLRVVALVVAAAIVTAWAVPMIALYMLGVVVAFLFGKKRTKEPGD